MRLELLFAMAVSFSALGCGGAPPPSPGVPELHAKLGHAHPLNGRIWSRDPADFVTRDALLTHLKQAPWVLLGEKHDNPDHHRLHAELLADLLRADPRPVGFEMLDLKTQPAVNRAKTPEGLAKAVDWAHRGWPDFALYRPVFAAVMGAKARVVAAHPNREALMQMLRGPESGWPTADLPAGPAETLASHIRASHCGHADDRMVRMMTVAQQHKDSTMAGALVVAGDTGVLVAGNGHVRRDYGVPRLLKGAVSVGFLEVQPDKAAPTEYDTAAFDYVWFTARVDDLDPCEVFREQLEKMGAPGR